MASGPWLDVEVKGRGAAAAERGGPHRHGGAALDLAPVADDAAGAAADQHGRRERLVHALERGLGRGQVRSGGEDADDVGARALERRAAPADPPRSPPGAGRSRSTAHSRCARSRAGRYSCPVAASAPSVLAIFGPTGVGKTALAFALAERLRGRGERPVAVSADALQVYQGLETLTGVAPARRARAPGAPPGLDPARRRALLGRRVRRAGPRARSTRCSRARLADRGRRHRPVPARRARRSSTCAPRRPMRCARAGRPSSSDAGREALHAELARRAPWAAASHRPARPQPDRAPLELLELGELEPPDGAQPAVDLRHAPSRRGWSACHGARRALRADRRARRRDGGRGRRRRGPRRPRRRAPRRPRARRWASTSCWPATSRP